MEKFIPDENIHDGHRGRMRAKLLSHGRSIFDTYELLEMLLYYSVPFRDTNPVAKRLLHAFGSLDGALKASREELTRVIGVGDHTAELITLVGRLNHILGAELLPEEIPYFTSFNQVGEYFTDYFRGVEEKCVVAMFLDSNMRMLRLRKLYNLEYESGGVKAKAFLDEAVFSNAAVIISAHNHPYSSCHPTPGDRETNFYITDALAAAGFVHAEHYIISGGDYAGIGSMKRFTSSIKQMPAVSQFVMSREGSDDDLCVAKCKRAPKELILPEEIYNKGDLNYFASLLAYAVGDQATEIATRILKKYQTIENTMTASVSELSELTDEKCACFIKLLAHITSRRNTEKFKLGEAYSSVEIADHLKAVFLGESVEKIYLLTFDREDRLTGCHLLAEGTVCSSDVLPRKAVERALSSSAASVSIAHNHPFGSPRPSTDDVTMTEHFAGIFKSCDVVLKEHYIIAGQLSGTVYFES